MTRIEEDYGIAQEVVGRLNGKRTKALEELEELSGAITAGLLAGESVSELITHQVALKNLIPAIDAALPVAMKRATELQREAQRQTLGELLQLRANLEREYQELEGTLIRLRREDTQLYFRGVMVERPERQELGENIQAAGEKQQAVVKKSADIDTQIASLKRSVGVS